MCYFDRSGMATKHLHRAMKGISARRAVAARTNHDGENDTKTPSETGRNPPTQLKVKV
jgi:hypothetical protein